MARLTVTFTRIGRAKPAPLTVEPRSQAELVDAIASYARRYLASPTFRVVLASDGRRGFIACGMRQGGDFQIASSDAAPMGVSAAAAG